MGMGDKQKPFEPSYKTHKCGVCHFPAIEGVSIRSCPHPAVQRKYGGDVCVCVYCCKRCKFAVKNSYFDGVGCGYGY